jgi:hypothetical protein
MTPKEAAEALYAILPKALSPNLLEDYGIGATDEQARVITREVLSVNLYWIYAAVEAHIPREYRAVLFEYLVGLIHESWQEGFQQGAASWEEYLRDMEERCRQYAGLMVESPAPLAVAQRMGEILEEQGTLRSEDQSQLLALLTDLVPIDQYGALLEEA